MKIKLALLDKDINYLNRIVTMCNVRYADKLEIYSFTDQASAFQTISTKPVDLLIASDQFEIEDGTIPANCGFAYFVESNSIETLRNKPAICKFQKIDLIFKQILSIYSETASRSTKFRFDDSASKTLFFASASGGVGGSTIAAACAVAIAKQSKRVLFLNLEGFGAAESFFSGEGQFTLGDVIYAIKGRKSNLSLKLESAVKQDVSGVYYFSAPEVALDIHDLAIEDIQRLLNEVRLSGLYDFIVLTADFGFDEKSFLLWKEASKVIMISDGSDVANLKFDRMYKSLQILEQQNESVQTYKMNILYNKFSNKTGKTISGLSVKTLGGIPRFEHATTQQVISQIAGMEVMTELALDKEA